MLLWYRIYTQNNRNGRQVQINIPLFGHHICVSTSTLRDEIVVANHPITGANRLDLLFNCWCQHAEKSMVPVIFTYRELCQAPTWSIYHQTWQTFFFVGTWSEGRNTTAVLPLSKWILPRKHYTRVLILYGPIHSNVSISHNFHLRRN